MKFLQRTATFCLLAILLSSAALADDFDNKLASIQLLQDKGVQTALGVSEAQRKKLNVHAQKFNGAREAYRQELIKKSNGGKVEVKPDRNREMKILTQFKADVLGELSAGQIKRLREISLQAVGVTALGEDMVAARIGLTKDQKTRIRKLVGDGLTSANKLLNQANQKAMLGIEKPKTQAEAQKAQAQYEQKAKVEQTRIKPQLERIRSQTISQVMAVLNTKQKTAWQALLGKPFKV